MEYEKMAKNHFLVNKFLDRLQKSAEIAWKS